MGGFKFVIALVLKLNKTINNDETKYSTFYSNSKAEINIHNTDTNSILKSIYCTIMTKIRKYQTEGSSSTIDLVTEQNITISKCQSLSDSSYIISPK